jgi:hypothetical protein
MILVLGVWAFVRVLLAEALGAFFARHPFKAP